MTAHLDCTDVPQVDPDLLALPMQHMIDAGRGLVLLRGICDAELREVERAVWDEIDANASARVATLLRFRCLIGVFASSRLQQLFLRRGLALLAPAMQVAAQMRLNVQWGFSPVKFALALEAKLAQIEEPRTGRRIERTHELQAAMA